MNHFKCYTEANGDHCEIADNEFFGDSQIAMKQNEN